jgi:cellulose biosynthesis protein BcsQ
VPYNQWYTPLGPAVFYPKGSVGRSASVWQLGVELALRGQRVALIDRDQGQHLSQILEFYPGQHRTQWIRSGHSWDKYRFATRARRADSDRPRNRGRV